ncbi:MAG: V-type ATP synthase subunit A [bacterium]|nr:V-type ATP synthase subunit A [bacterium]
MNGKIIKVSGPLVLADCMQDARMFDLVKVGNKKLIGEIIELRGDVASIQVYEETAGIGPDEPVISTGRPLSVELGPGLIESIYDGIQRPLDILMDKTGEYITRGVSAPGIDRNKKWHFVPSAKAGDTVRYGDAIGTVQETNTVIHKIMVPSGVEGKIEKITEGKFAVEDTVAVIKTDKGSKNITMLQYWPVRIPRPYQKKLVPETPLITGQRVIDTFFPIARGGTACIPGPFGSGKTVVQHQLAKWSDAEIIVYIGCGERGNEMTDVLMEFPQLKDPKTGNPLMKRTVLIANTSNMPVAAREASIYTGVTIAEYYRDMGYNVAVMADSTSRWAEALREMSGRLEEMPGEEGYPAYLPAKLAEFYERAGRVICKGADSREGTLSIIGAVSPPGGDLSDPVVQGTLKVVKVFWALEDKLAYRRHFPAISWINSYSLYLDNIHDFLKENLGEDWMRMRQEGMKLLQQETDLQEIVRLVGLDTLSVSDRLILETAKSIREDFLHQNAFHEIDTYTSLKKQYRMLKLIMMLHEKCIQSLGENIPIESLTNLKIREDISRMRFIHEKELDKFSELEKKVEEEISQLTVESKK